MATVREPTRMSSYEHLVNTLAQESSASPEHVRELFESTRAELESEARIKTYVSVIATRLVRNVLQAERNSANG